MELQGKIKTINATQEISASFKKREFVLETAEQYPQLILLEFAQDKCGLLDTYTIGDDVSVGINIRGREWVNPQGETKYFNTIQAWKINKVNEATVNETPVNEPQNLVASNESDGLPF